jgi:FkbM family methyltransferase
MKRFIKHCLRKVNIDLARRRDSFLDQKLLLGDLPRPTIFDVGANAGQSAMAYHRMFPHAQITSFEPVPSLRQEFAANLGALPVEIVPLAVSDTLSEIEFFEYNVTGYNSISVCTVPGVQVVNKTRVKTTTIDQFCDERGINSINILKLDIQGSELKALRGARAMLARQAVDVVFSEILFSRQYEQQAMYYEIAAFLDGLGYPIFRCYDLFYAQNRRLAYTDAIFCRKELNLSDRLRNA